MRSWGSGEDFGGDMQQQQQQQQQQTFFFVKQKVAIARVVAGGFWGRRLWGARNRENRLFFVNLSHAIERGSSPVHGTICKIARFVDFEKL